MEVGLTVGRWVLDRDALPVVDAASTSLVRERVRATAARIGLPDLAAAALVNVASELAHNQLAHAEARGFVAVHPVSRGADVGLEVVAADSGRGIPDIARALEGRPSGDSSLGIGLAAVLELADEVDFDVRLTEGTCVWARKFARSETRRRRVGIYGRPCPGEITSGDDAAFARLGDWLSAGVADGLGHGEAAREAAERARNVLLASPEIDPQALLTRCDAALARTRGAVMAVARIDEGRGEIDVSSVGNVGAQLVGASGSRRFGGSSFVLGAPGGARRMATEHRRMEPRDVLLLCSDGVSSRADLTGDHSLLREHPVVIAQRVVERFARDGDDVTVMAVG